MQLQTFAAQDSNGNVQTSPTVYIYALGTTNPISGIEDENGDELTNPFTGGADGRIVLAAPTGIYDMRVVKGAFDSTQVVQFIDLDAQVAAATAQVGLATTQANNAASSASAAAGSAAAAAEIVNITDVQTFTNSLRRAVRVAMTAAASGSRGIQVLDNANLDMGTNNFTMHWEGSLPNWGSATVSILLQKRTGVFGVDAIGYLMTITSGVAQIQVVNSALGLSIAQNFSYAFGSLTAGSHNKITIAVDRQSEIRLSVNGVLAQTVNTTVSDNGSTISNTASLEISGGSGTRAASDTTNCLIYNRALSAAEVLSLSVNGPALADIGASQVAVYESDFSAGLDNWSATGGVSAVNAGNIDTDADGVGVPPSNDWQRSLRSGSAGTLGFYGNDAAIKPPTTVGNRLPYAECDVFIPAGSPVTHITASWENNTNSVFAVSPGVNRITFGGAVLTNTSTRAAFIRATNSEGVTASQPDGSAIYLKDFSWKYVGITGQWSAEDAQSNTGQIFDSSGNGNHALLPAAGATIIGRPTAQPQQVRWTNTWNGTHELQYIGGVNQAILPAKAYIESIVGVVTGATPHDIIIGDGSDTDRYVTITTGLAAGTTTFTLANRTTDGTNLKLTVDPDTDATMSIAWTITYRTLE